VGCDERDSAESRPGLLGHSVGPGVALEVGLRLLLQACAPSLRSRRAVRSYRPGYNETCVTTFRTRSFAGLADDSRPPTTRSHHMPCSALHAALMQLAQRQPAPGTSLAAVLSGLKIRAGEDTHQMTSFIQGFQLCDALETDVLLLDRRIVLHYTPPPEDGASRPALNYLLRPASSLPPRDSDEHSDPNSEDDLTRSCSV
jgi:hypothetical protein